MSRVTVRKAVQALVQGRLLVQRRGSGTFVAPRVERVEQALSLLTSFSEDMARRGKTVRSVWLDRGAVPAVARGDDGARADRRRDRWRGSSGLRLADELAARHRARLAVDERAARPGAVGASLYAVLAERGLRPVRAVQRISAANLGEADAGLLEVPVGAAGLRIERISYLRERPVVEFTRSLYRGDAYDFVAELQTRRRSEEGASKADRRDTICARDRGDPGRRRAVPRRVRRRAGRRRAACARPIPRFITTVARGSSDHAATYLKYAVELTAGVPVASVGPSVASIYGARLRLAGRPASASRSRARAPTSSRCARGARAGGALTIAITNIAGSPMAAASDHALAAAGAGESVAATKTFVASVLAAWRWSRSGRRRRTCAPRCGAARAVRAALACDWTALAGGLVRANSPFVLGRGPGFAIANEMALKFKETCAIHAESYSAAEVLHGPAALVRRASRCWRSPSATRRGRRSPPPPSGWRGRARTSS